MLQIVKMTNDLKLVLIKFFVDEIKFDKKGLHA